MGFWVFLKIEVLQKDQTGFRGGTDTGERHLELKVFGSKSYAL